MCLLPFGRLGALAHSASPGLAFEVEEDAQPQASSVPEVASELLHALQEEQAVLLALQEEQACLEQLQIMEALREEEANLGELIAMMTWKNLPKSRQPPTLAAQYAHTCLSRFLDMHDSPTKVQSNFCPGPDWADTVPMRSELSCSQQWPAVEPLLEDGISQEQLLDMAVPQPKPDESVLDLSPSIHNTSITAAKPQLEDEAQSQNIPEIASPLSPPQTLEAAAEANSEGPSVTLPGPVEEATS